MQSYPGEPDFMAAADTILDFAQLETFEDLLARVNLYNNDKSQSLEVATGLQSSERTKFARRLKSREQMQKDLVNSMFSYKQLFMATV